MESHDEFRELCAISTSAELSEQEQRKLKEHLTACAECRQALKEFEAVVDVGISFLASQLSTEQSARSALTLLEGLEVKSLRGVQGSRAIAGRHRRRRACFRCCRTRFCLRSEKSLRA